MTIFAVAASHLTRFGTIIIAFSDEAPTGRPSLGLFLDRRFIQQVSDTATAAAAVAGGSYDDLLGFSAKEAGVPDFVEDWRDPLANLDSDNGVAGTPGLGAGKRR